MNFSTVCRHFGTPSAIAAALGISIQAVSRMKKTGKVPIRRQYELERITNGKLKARACGPTKPRGTGKNNYQSVSKFGVSPIDSRGRM